MIKVANKNSIAVNIWVLAFGYLVFYAPYSALTKALSSGSLTLQGAISGAELLPFVLLGTVITMPAIIACLGWYRYTDCFRVSPQKFIWPSRWALFSGVSFSIIIAATTLAYSFEGVSVIFALLLMRGGVLVLSPIVDFMFGRRVRWYSWLGLTLSLLAVGMSLINVDEYSLSWIVLLNLIAYLSGYTFRLHFMSHYAKDAHEAINRKFFVDENIVCMLALLFMSFSLMGFYVVGSGEDFIDYLLIARISGVLWPALMIGVLYGFLGVFGSLIYLNRRENTFSIPVNRCSSLVSGVLASFILAFLFEGQAVSSTQISCAVFIVIALLFMSFFDYLDIHRQGNSSSNPLQNTWLFICDGNRMRSPMAAAICNKVLENYMSPINKKSYATTIYADSAALTLGDKRLLPAAAKHALSALGVSLDGHRAKQVCRKQVRSAEKIFCMSSDQRLALIDMFPWVETKIYLLGGDVDIDKPSGDEAHHFLELARQLRESIHRFIDSLESNVIGGRSGFGKAKGWVLGSESAE